jgi:RNA polymerase sigma factor (sigma-70 family)
MNEHADIQGANAVRPGQLRETHRYVHEADTLADLRELEALPVRQAVRSAQSRRPEALVAYLRRLAAAGKTDAAWEIVEVLTVMIEPYVRGQLARWPWLDRDTKADVSHDLAVRLYQEWFRDGASATFWEIRFWHCVRLRLLDALRATCRTPAVLPLDQTDTAAGRPEPSVPGPSVEDAATARAMLHSLPPNEQKVFWMKFYARMTEDEIAAQMGVSSRTVRNIVTRARRMMGVSAREVGQS